MKEKSSKKNKKPKVNTGFVTEAEAEEKSKPARSTVANKKPKQPSLAEKRPIVKENIN